SLTPARPAASFIDQAPGGPRLHAGAAAVVHIRPPNCSFPPPVRQPDRPPAGAAFAVPSRIALTLAASGAGSAAYRYCRLVNVPGSSIMLSSMRSPVRPLLALAACVLFWPLAAMAEPTPTAINVNVDQAKLVKLPSRV